MRMNKYEIAISISWVLSIIFGWGIYNQEMWSYIFMLIGFVFMYENIIERCKRR